MILLGIAGICGKMGSRIHALAKEDKDFKVSLGLEFTGHPHAHTMVDGVEVSSDPGTIKMCDCLIDFTTPAATLNHLKYLLEFKKCAVIGTTGLNDSQQKEIIAASRSIAIVFSPNMSVGVQLLFKLLGITARSLPKYTVHIEEAHHIHKKDAPSGTAKKIAEIINKEGFTIKNEDILAIRKDEIVGDHKIVFESDVDRIELSHSAKTRDIFAQGALRAAKWLVHQKNGLYTMDDVLSIK